jgi:hypothetical protein
MFGGATPLAWHDGYEVLVCTLPTGTVSLAAERVIDPVSTEDNLGRQKG